jgi:hypothetical protein
MRTLAMTNTTLNAQCWKHLTACLGTGWVKGIQWAVVDSANLALRALAIIEKEQPDVVVAVGQEMFKAVAIASQACPNRFALHGCLDPSKMGRFNTQKVLSSLKRLRTTLDLELNTRTAESGANK